MTVFPNGDYRIFNTVFQGQDANLLRGGPTALIVGRHNGTDLDNVWRLSNVGYMGNQFTLQNQAPSANGAYAGVQDEIDIGVQLHGSPKPLTWTAVATCIPEQYMLLAPVGANSTVPTALVWSLDSSTDGAPISLEFMYSIDSDPDSIYARALNSNLSSAWNFLPFKH